MRALRLAILISLLGGLAQPAFARIDMDELVRTMSAPSPQEAAVQAVLDTQTDADDPIEKLALDGVRGFYTSRNFELLWLGGRITTPQMTALRSAMDRAAEYGLDPASYRTPSLAETYPDAPARLAEADVDFSRAVARFVTHLASGRIRPTDISPLITLEPEHPDIAKALALLSASIDVAADVQSFEPPHPEYAALKVALAKLRATADDSTRIVVPEGELLKPGKTDARVPLLRARLAVALAESAEPEVYDDAVVTAVKAFQAEHDLNDDGIVGPRTLVMMNGRSREEELAAVVANLERWRWMPRDLGAFYVFVNVPEFTVRVISNGAVTHETRVVVGKPTNPTPTFSNTMSHVIVNPYWNVPTSIVKNEMLPEIRGNPYGYFASGEYEVFARVGGRMRQIDPYWVDWRMVNASSVQIRQIPGDFNALGRIKFMFPNQHDVYLHDTPSKRLFQRDYRALSHGCVRVENPLEFADAILPVAAPDWNSTRLEKLYGGAERRVNLDTPVPVHLAYFTMSAGPDGALRSFEDIYGYDAEMTAFLGS